MTSPSLLEIHFIHDSKQIPRRLSLLISLPANILLCIAEAKAMGLLSEMDGMKRAGPHPPTHNSYINHFVLLIHLITCREKAAALEARLLRRARSGWAIAWGFLLSY